MNIEITNPIINQIKEATREIPGWCPEDQLFAMYLLAISTGNLEGDFLEIGSFCGKSSVALAMAAKKIKTNLNCIDLFPEKMDWFEDENEQYNFNVKIGDKSYSLEKHKMYKEPYMNCVVPVYEKYGSNLMEIFLKNINDRKLGDIVTAFKGTSNEFAKNFNKKVKFAFIDGEHSYNGIVNDIKNVEELLVSGAYVVFDDAFSNYIETNRAINELIINSGKYDILQQLTRKCFAARKI